MSTKSEINVHQANRIVDNLSEVMHRAEPALEEDELKKLSRAISFVEDAAGIETGERIMNSEMTDQRYIVTRWADLGDGQMLALSKREIDDGGDSDEQ
jgi:hypothetical protein